MMTRPSDLQVRFTRFRQSEPSQHGRHSSGYAMRDRRLHGKTATWLKKTEKGEENEVLIIHPPSLPLPLPQCLRLRLFSTRPPTQ